MVFTCEAKECFSHSDKLKKPDKYPWMKEVKWVKWPRNDKAAVARWKKLIHRTGKQLKINKRSRLCSLHFDRDDYDVWGTPLGDPKYFSWNNWGKPIRERSDSTIEKLDLARRRVGEPHPPVLVGGQPKSRGLLMKTMCHLLWHVVYGPNNTFIHVCKNPDAADGGHLVFQNGGHFNNFP